jgi:putative ABC transport system substrate-binding protein
MRRREFIAGLGAAAWVSPTRAQQSAVPVVGFVYAGSADTSVGYLTHFRKGLGKTGYVEGQSVTVEYRWLDGQLLSTCKRRGRSASKCHPHCSHSPMT